MFLGLLCEMATEAVQRMPEEVIESELAVKFVVVGAEFAPLLEAKIAELRAEISAMQVVMEQANGKVN